MPSRLASAFVAIGKWVPVLDATFVQATVDNIKA